MANEPDLIVSAGFSDAQLVREANKVVEHFRRRGEEAQKAFQDAQGRVTNTQAARAHQRELDRLARAYDPAYRAAKKYEEEIRRLDRALDVGAISQQQYAARVAGAAREWQRAGEVVQEAGRKVSGGGNMMQQVGWQVGDFAVQVGAGTSAAQAFAQQAPQLLGAMGAWGALAGAGVAIAVPLGAALLKVAMDAETLEDRVDALTKSTDAYVAAAEAASTPIDDLRARYGELADEIARANSAMAFLTSVQARSDLFSASRGLGRQLGFNLNPSTPMPVRGDGTVDPNWEFMRRKELERQMERLNTLTGATAEQFERLRMAINRTDSSNSIEAVARDAENLLGIIAEMAGNEGADQDFLHGWAAQVDAVLRQAQKQIEASADASIREQQRVIDKYETDTEKLRSLANDRAVAQQLLDEAIKRGSEEAIRQAEQRLRLVDEEIRKTQALARANDEAFVAMQKRIQASASGFIDGLFETATGNSLTQWGKDLAASQKGILDLIASRESGGDYNATLDNGRWTNGPRDLVNMTLREILALQSSMRTPENRALYGNGAGSSALGRYQITGRTLEGLISELGLTGNELFSREMQDRLALQLVRRRLPQGVEGLRNEWEGLRGVSPAVIQQALGQQSIERTDPELQREQDRLLKEEVRERERLAKQAKDYGDQLAANLLSQQQAADLATRQAKQIAEIRKQGLGEEDESRAIAHVTAEIERERTVLMLLAEAKRRNVDLDAMLADGSMTYRQAIEALGEAKRADILATNERAIAEGKAAEAQQFMADAQERVRQGLIDSIVAGESFSEVLANLARSFASAALQAALFNQGPFASGSTGGGLLGGAFNWIFGRARANGGPVQAGVPYLVGERGPEPFVPAVDGRVLSNAEAQAALRSGRGGGPLNVTIQNQIPGGQYQVEQVSRDEVRIIAAQVYAAGNRRAADNQYLGPRR